MNYKALTIYIHFDCSTRRSKNSTKESENQSILSFKFDERAVNDVIFSIPIVYKAEHPRHASTSRFCSRCELLFATETHRIGTMMQKWISLKYYGHKLGHDGNYTLNHQLLLLLLLLLLPLSIHSKYHLHLAPSHLNVLHDTMTTRRKYIFRKIFYTGFSLSFILNENFHSPTHTKTHTEPQSQQTQADSRTKFFHLSKENTIWCHIFFFQWKNQLDM